RWGMGQDCSTAACGVRAGDDGAPRHKAGEYKTAPGENGAFSAWDVRQKAGHPDAGSPLIHTYFDQDLGELRLLPVGSGAQRLEARPKYTFRSGGYYT
ncbi:unnamed protein product, partial [Polarella glacialis]